MSNVLVAGETNGYDRRGRGVSTPELITYIYTNLNINLRKDAMLGYSSKQRIQFSER